MKVRDLVAHLQKLNQDADILPTWEQHVPGDFGGFWRVRADSEPMWAHAATELILLDCENYGSDAASWELPPP